MNPRLKIVATTLLALGLVALTALLTVQVHFRLVTLALIASCAGALYVVRQRI